MRFEGTVEKKVENTVLYETIILDETKVKMKNS